MMRKLPDGPYFYYLPQLPKPRVAEIEGDVAWFAGDDQCVRLDKCSGRFVRLQECPLVEDQEPDPPHGFYAGTNPAYAPDAQEPVAATDSPIVSDADIV